jgi:hypothetical protein
MKKLSIFLALLLLFGMFAFAEDEAAVEYPAAEDVQTALSDLSALKAQTPVAVTGKIGFTVSNDTKVGTPKLPVMAGTKSATAKMTISAADGLVSASIGLDLLKDPTVATTLTRASDDTMEGGYSIYAPEYQDYLDLKALVEFVDSNFEIDDTDDNDIFGADHTFFDTLVSTINAQTDPDIARAATSDDGENEIVLYDPVADDATPGTDQFQLTTSDVGTVTATEIANALAAAQSSIGVLDDVNDFVDDVVQAILDDADDITLYSINSLAELDTYFASGIDVEDTDNFTTNDIDCLQTAVDFAASYKAVTEAFDENAYTVETKLTAASFISSASFSLMKIFGVVDMTGNMSGQNVKVGMIALDGKGHTSTSVSGYPSLKLSLSSGVVSGVSAAVTLYSDDNADKDDVAAVADTWYTWPDETVAAADPVEPKLGLLVDGGYSTAVGDMTVGANVAVGLYDLLSTADPSAMQFGLSIKPSFSGFGATVSGEFDMGLNMTYIGADIGYSVMGIKPSVAFVMASTKEGEDEVITYVKDDKWTSAKSAVLDTGGMYLGAKASVDISQFAPITGSVSGNFDLGMPTGGENVIGWGASLSVTPVSLVTVAAGISDAGLYQGDATKPTLAFNASATVTYAPLKITGGISSAYNKDKDAAFLTWNGGVTLTHSIASVALTVSNAYDKDEDAAYLKYSMATSISF